MDPKQREALAALLREKAREYRQEVREGSHQLTWRVFTDKADWAEELADELLEEAP